MQTSTIKKSASCQEPTMPVDRRFFIPLIPALQLNLALICRQVAFYQQRIRALCQLMMTTNNTSSRSRINKSKKKRQARRFWVRPGRTQVWCQNFLNNIVVNEEWKENFRMTKNTFMALCEELRGHLQKNDTHLREALDVEKQVGITLYYLSDEGLYRKVANAFGVSRSSVSFVIRNVTRAISKHLRPKYIKLPMTEAEVRNMHPNIWSIMDFHNVLELLMGPTLRSSNQRITILTF